MDSKIMTALGDRLLTLGPAPAADSPYRHFKLTRDADGVAWLLFDRADASANTLSSDVMEEFDAVLAAIETERPAGLVIRSAKPSGFIAGADVNEFRGASDPGMVETRIRAAHAVVDHLEALKLPTVAVIHGFCLGGGLEVALACQARIAIEGARFGFPEVMLGLHPGLGGTARFTALVNPTQSMALMLTGRTIDARRAKAIGLVDTVTQERHVHGAVKDALFGRLKRARPGLLARAANLGPVRGLLARRMRAEAAKAASREHYPAPYALIDLWEAHGGSKAAMLKAEQASFAKLMVTPTAQNYDPRLLPARADEEGRRQRQCDQARPCHRRRRHGRRHRGLVCRAGPSRLACRHEGGADRGRGEARSRALWQDHPQADGRA
ncbi:enoyl-CoA hydratase/carnithine racemase [Bradyrhizobium liaoningense]